MRYFYVLLSLVCFYSGHAQVVVNAYARVTAVTGGNVLSLSNIDQTNHSFIVGEKVIVMQMQDNVIGTNTTNVSTFGDLAAIGNAGKFEVAVISATAAAAMTLSATLTNTYNINTNAVVQVISFRNLGASYTTSASIAPLSWNGNIGGVLAIEVTNTLTLNHSLVADGRGFAGGTVSTNADETCSNTVYIINSNLKGYKGEGIYKSTDVNFTNGRGKILSGGGGGCQNNAGGGGGGNYTAGGNGGLGWQCTAANSGYGLGGISLSSYISGTRVFMGGGGGGGQQNNGAGTSGGNGGGIILVKAGAIATSATCGSSIRISANGNTAANSGNDGAGGGGAAGSILLQAAGFSVTATCPMTVSANGGNGGSVTNSGSHGGGAGGGQGIIIYAIAQPTINITTTTNNGAGGANDSGGGSYAGGGSGTNNQGIVSGSVGILPVELISFDYVKENEGVRLLWATATEKDNDHFAVEKSADGINYTLLGTVKGSGTSLRRQSYDLYDPRPFSTVTYYRLKQTDRNATFRYVGVIAVSQEENLEFSIFPNPVSQEENISIRLNKNNLSDGLSLEVNDVAGKTVFARRLDNLSQSELNLPVKQLGLEKGVYLVKLKNGSRQIVKKLVVK